MPDDSANPRDESQTGREASESEAERSNELASRLRDAADRATAAADAKPGPLAASPHRALARTAENLAAAAEARVDDAAPAEAHDDFPRPRLRPDDEPLVTGPLADGLATGAHVVHCPHLNCPWWTSSDSAPLATLHLGDHLLLVHSDPTCTCGHPQSDHDEDDDGCDGAAPDGDGCMCERFVEVTPDPRLAEIYGRLGDTDRTAEPEFDSPVGGGFPSSPPSAPSPQGVIEMALELDGLGNRFADTSQLLSGLHDADLLAEKLAAAGVSPTHTAEVIRECHAALKALNDALAS